jgi:chromosomal replication initiation ATPase DnaA
VAQVHDQLEAQGRHRPRAPSLERLVTAVCRHVGIPPVVLQAGSRRRDVARARDGIAYLWLEVWGQSGRAVAEALGVRPQSIYRAAQRGRKESQEWGRIAIR